MLNGGKHREIQGKQPNLKVFLRDPQIKNKFIYLYVNRIFNITHDII